MRFKRHTTNFVLKRWAHRVATPALSLFILLFTTSVAYAVMNLHPNPGFGGEPAIPAGIKQALRECPDQVPLKSPGVVQWVSQAGAPSVTSFDVEADATAVSLAFQFAGAVCSTRSAVTATRAHVINESPAAVNGIAGQALTLDWGANYQDLGLYKRSADGFTYAAPSGGFTSGTYTVTLRTKTINRFDTGIFRCVDDAETIVSSLEDYGPCGPSLPQFTFRLNVIARYDHRAELRNGINTPSGGVVSAGQTYKLYPRVRNVGNGPTIDNHIMIVQNRNPEFTDSAGIDDLTPVADQADYLGIKKAYSTNNTACSAANDVPRDCWFWFFKTVSPNANVDSGFSFKVKDDAPQGSRLCFLPMVRRRTGDILFQIGTQQCYTVDGSITCPAGSNFTGPITSQPDRNDDDTIDAQDCNNPPVRKYLRVYGNDVMAGSPITIGPTCTTTNLAASVESFAVSESPGGITNWKGSGSQFGTFALGPVTNFFSANMRGPVGAPGSSRPPVDLTFGNSADGSSKVAMSGGGYSGVSNCITDYYAERDTLQSGSTIAATTINRGSHQAVYYDHDVFITGTGIRFQDADGSWGNLLDTIPSYHLVVKGNIYIGPSVAQLDGIYVAQPNDDGTKGEIITCAVNPGITPPGVGACNSKLTVNGAFIAKRVQFKRTAGDLTLAGANEGPDSAQIAEVFNFSPEVYLSTLHPSLQYGAPFTKYDYITSLPPIL